MEHTLFENDLKNPKNDILWTKYKITEKWLDVIYEPFVDFDRFTSIFIRQKWFKTPISLSKQLLKSLINKFKSA